MSGTTVTITPKAVGSATITVTGAGGTNYNSISKTYAATVKVGTTYIYWAGRINKQSSIQLETAMDHASKADYIIYGSSPINACVCTINQSIGGSGCTSEYEYCPMMRDTYTSGTFSKRDVCLYNRVQDKMFCFDFNTYSQPYGASNIQNQLKSDLTSTFGSTAGTTCTVSSTHEIYCYNKPSTGNLNQAGYVRAGTASWNGDTRYARTTFQYSGGYQICEISSQTYQASCRG